MLNTIESVSLVIHIILSVLVGPWNRMYPQWIAITIFVLVAAPSAFFVVWKLIFTTQNIQQHLASEEGAAMGRLGEHTPDPSLCSPVLASNVSEQLLVDTSLCSPALASNISEQQLAGSAEWVASPLQPVDSVTVAVSSIELSEVTARGSKQDLCALQHWKVGGVPASL